MKRLSRLIENAIIAAINGAFWLGLFLIFAWLVRVPEQTVKVIASVMFGIGFIAAFIILAVVQSIPNEPD